MPPDSRFPSGYPPAPGTTNDPYSQHPDHESACPQPGGPNGAGGPTGGQMISSGGQCLNPVRMMSNLVEDNNKQMTNNPYANATSNWPPASGPQASQQTPQQPEQTPNNGPPQGPTNLQQGASPNSNPANTDEK